MNNKDIWHLAISTYFNNRPCHPPLESLTKTELENTPIYLNPSLKAFGEVIEPIIPELSTVYCIWDEMENRVISMREIKFQCPTTSMNTIKALHRRLLEINKILAPLMNKAIDTLSLPIIVDIRPEPYLFKADGKIYKGIIDPHTKAFKERYKVSEKDAKLNSFPRKLMYYAYKQSNSLGTFHIRAFPVNETNYLKHTWEETVKNETTSYNIMQLTVKRMYFARSRSLSIGTILIHCCSQQYATIYAQAGLEVCPHPCPTRGDMAWQACNGSMHGNSITYMRCGLPGIMRHRTYAQTSQLSCMCSGRAGKKHKHGSQL